MGVDVKVFSATATNRPSPCRLHQRRHHTTYAIDFYTKPTDQRMPYLANIDESACLVLLPFGLLLMGCSCTIDICLSNSLGLLVAFYLHTAAFTTEGLLTTGPDATGCSSPFGVVI